MSDRDYLAEARDLIQFELDNHPDPGVRALAAICEPPAKSVEQIAAALRAKAERAA